MALVTPSPAIPDVPFTPDLAQLLSFGPGQPLVLLPVRLETRFSPLPDGGAELRVRVYPDKVHIDTHEPELTHQELIWGKHFWEQTWRAANDEEARKRAWRQLVKRFDAPRAAWIARVLTPLNATDRPASPLANAQPLPKPIRFPSPPTKSGAWTRAPLTRVLPKRWWVFGYAGGTLVVKAAGNPIPDTLATGPDPASDRPFATGELAADPGMKWMLDFAEAEKVGMGIRLRLTSDQTQGFDILLVCGTKSAPDLTDGTPDLVQLLDAHHYTDGLGFVLQGTPSNNTPDAPSGFRSTDPGQAASYLAERGGTVFNAGDGSNADRLANALGLHRENAVSIATLANANATEQLDARHMNRALWPATWGYFLTQMMGVNARNETPLTPDDFSWARQHFIDYVRAAGPLPAMRVGRQPYGILPVTSLNAWKPKAGQEARQARDAALAGFLGKLRELWRANLSQVPRIGRSENPDQDFTDIFSMDGLSSNCGMRHLMGEAYLQRLWSFMVPGDQSFWWNKQQELTKSSLNALGLDWNHPRLSHAAYSGWHAALKGSAIQPELLAEDAPLAPDFIELLLNETDLDKIHREAFGEVQPQGLLYSLLRHAFLLEYWTAAVNLLSDPQSLDYWVRYREQELVGPPSFTGFLANMPGVWEQFSATVAAVSNDPLGVYLGTLRSPPADPDIAARVATLLEFRESLAHLKSVSAAKLQRLFAGTLDLCSHRLDAWITSFATKRLAEIRADNPGGVLLGGYGWVMNLQPADPPAVEPAPTGEQGVVLRPANNPGYTHTPSLAQASTVAVLRSGHLTHADADTKDLLAIDLSSERVRLAAWLLDGVRQGQPLGALLGYRFERRLHDAGLGQFIPYFREIAPLVAKKLPQTDDQTVPRSVESIAANNVADGLVLQRKWTQAGTLAGLFSGLDRPYPDPARETALQAELMLLDHAVDAVSDALLAESVHHAVQGNPLRTAGTLDAIASGETPPPELDVVQTPRTGIALTHRLITLFGGPPTVPPQWKAPAVPHRAQAEPYLNAWAARLLGNPAHVRCLIERIDPSNAAVLETKELRLNELRLAPLDLIYAAAASRDAQPSEIEQRMLYAIIRKTGGFVAEASLRINPGRAAGWPASDVSYGEFTEVLRTARRLITGARGIDGSELNLPEKNQAVAVDFLELRTRADKAVGALRRLRADLKALLDEAATAKLEALRELILQAAHFGIPGAVPFSATGDTAADRQTLLLQGSSIASELGQRIDRIATLAAAFKPARASDQDKRNHQLARLHASFGDSFVVLPRFSADNAAELQLALADSAKIQGDDALAVVAWFQRASRVREGVARLDAAMRYAEALETGEQLSLSVAQLPYRAQDQWVGLPFAVDQGISPSRFSIVVQAAPTLDVKQAMTGLLIDEWVELVPNASETTGMVFQYDQPDAAPPQSILLAVPPDLDQPWNLWSIQQVLLETLDLARIRAVDPDALDDVGHYLPALYFAVNAAGDTVATDFSKLT